MESNHVKTRKVRREKRITREKCSHNCMGPRAAHNSLVLIARDLS